jgi:lactate dehydrogenase-like 2-hydroxyacid dehydrogenase
MVMNTPGGNTISTAQLTLSMLCALARNIPAADSIVKQVLFSLARVRIGPFKDRCHKLSLISSQIDFFKCCGARFGRGNGTGKT